MYCLVPEKPLRPVYETRNDAIGVTFYERVLYFATLFTLFTPAALQNKFKPEIKE
jgi:hypothetical protein